jgi:YacP-like NYN domain
MPVVVDGNNLLHTLAPGKRNRAEVRRQALAMVRAEGLRLTVVFDGAPPGGTPEVEHLGRVTVRYSCGASADEVILGLLPAGCRAADWVVVTADRGLRERVRERGAKTRTLQQWRDRKPLPSLRPSREPKLSSRDVADWEIYFSSGRDDEDQNP